MNADDQQGASRYAIRAVIRVCDILDTVRSEEGATLAEIATATDLPKSSVFRYLTTLEERNYVRRDEDSARFKLGFAFQPYDQLLIEQLKSVTAPHLVTLRDRIGETANLGVLNNGQILHLLVEESKQPMRLAARVGDRAPIHSTALGKVLAAGLTPEQVHRILETYGLPAHTAMTIVDEGAYTAQLDTARRNGFAIDDSENQVGGRCIAVPIHGIGISAGLSVSAPALQMPEARIPVIVEELQKAAAEVANKLSAVQGTLPLSRPSPLAGNQL